MKITQLIFELEKIKADHGDLPVYSLGEYAVEGRIVPENKQLYIHIFYPSQEMFSQLPKRLAIGYWRE